MTWYELVDQYGFPWGLIPVGAFAIYVVVTFIRDMLRGDY